MRKAVSIILLLFMLFGAYSAVQVSAGETEQVSVIETQVFVDKLNKYLESDKTLRTYVFGNEVSLGVETDFKLNANNIESKTTLFLEKDGSVVFGFVDNTCAESYEIIGGYKFKNSLCIGSTGNKTGICVYKEEKVYTLREAIEKNVYTVEELAEIIPNTEKVEEPTDETRSVIKSEEFLSKLNEYLESDKTLRTYVFGNEISLGVETDFKLNANNIESKTTLFLEKNGSVVFGFVDNTCAESYEIIGGYKFKNCLCIGSTGNKTGICVYKNGFIYSLREAVEQGLYTAEELAEIIPNTEKVEDPTTTQPTTAASGKETTDIATVAPATKPVTDVITVSPKKDAKKANPMKVTAKSKTVKAKKLKKSKVTVTAITVKNAKGKVTYKKLSGSKKLSVTKKGKITVKKGTKKGTYKLKVKITAKGNSQYLAKSVTKTVRVKVK